MGKIKDNTKMLWNHTEQVPIFVYLLRWLVLSALAGAVIGSGSALLLVSLEWATRTREEHLWLIALLPLAGLVIGLMYHYWAGTASKGNNYLIEEIRSPNGIIPFRMAPLVYVGTVLTHLFGGSVQVCRWVEPWPTVSRNICICRHATIRLWSPSVSVPVLPRCSVPHWLERYLLWR